MSKNSLFFVIFSLVLCLGISLSFSAFQRYFAHNGEAQFQVALLQKELVFEKEKNDLLSFQLRDLQNSLSAVIADVPEKYRTTQLKSLGAVLREPASVEPMDLSSVELMKAKEEFKKKNYDQAILHLKNLNRKFPLSPHLPEAFYFISESYFQIKDYRQAVKSIDQMISQFPDQELTGFAMIRLGKISELQGQKAEAFEIYNSVKTHFKSFPAVVKSVEPSIQDLQRRE